MKVKLNLTYIIEKKYCKILLKTPKNIFLERNNNILYMQNNFVVKSYLKNCLKYTKLMKSFCYFILFEIKLDISF